MPPIRPFAPRCRSHARCWTRSAPGTCRAILILNKIDKVAQSEREQLSKEFPAALLVSAKDPADVGRVRDAIIGVFDADMTEVDLVVPYDAGSAIGEIHKLHVIAESYEADGVHYRVRAPESALERIRAMVR